MPSYEIIVTDVTRYGDRYCVAGWDLNNGGMVRPEPADAIVGYEASRFWTSNSAGPGKDFAAGSLVQFQANGPPAHFPFPHATEDRIVVGGSAVTNIGTRTSRELAQLAVGSVSESLAGVFGNQLVRAASGKAYVPAGATVASLGAVEIDAGDIRFYEDVTMRGKRQLRAMVSEAGVDYDLSVPADTPRELFLTNGADAVQAQIQDCATLHVRIGLCRPFSAMPDKCYVQINGVYRL